MGIPASLIERLATLTKQNKLTWQPLGDDGLRTAMADTNFTLRERGSGHTLTIYDEDGNLLERASADQAILVSALNDAARNQALDVERKLKQIDALLANLERQ